MKRTHAAAVAVAVSVMTAGVGGRIAAGPTVGTPAHPTVAAPALPQTRGTLLVVPKADRYLGLRMQGGKMYAVNGSGGADKDITPRIVMGPQQAQPPVMRILPSPLLPKAPQPAPHR